MAHRTLNLGLIAGLFGTCALGCAHEVESPKLTLQSVGPDLLCNAQRLTPETLVVLSGSGFAPMPSNVLAEPPVLHLPSVSLTRTADLTGADTSAAPVAFSGEPSGEHAAELSWQSRAQLSLRITEPGAGSPGIQLDAGLYDVQVTNPDGKTLQALPRSLAVIEPPRVSSLAIGDSSVSSPLAVCASQASRSVNVAGSNFLSLDGAPPQVALSGQAASNVATSSCRAVPGTFAGSQVELCDGLTLTLGQNEFTPGTHSLVVTSAAPASCQSSEQRQLVVVPAPLVSRVAPTGICLDQDDQSLTVEGGSFAVVGGSIRPTVTVIAAGGAESSFQPESLSGCAPPEGTDASFGLELCTGLVFSLPSQQFQPGTYALRVSNPDPVGCSSGTNVDFTINPPPRVDAVAPGTVCSGGSVLIASGAAFQGGATAQLTCSSTTLAASLTAINGAGDQLSMTFGPGLEPGESCSLVVQNPDGCQDRPLPHQVVVGTEGPVLFNADPNVAYNDINTKVNLFVTALQPPFTVTMWPSGSSSATPVTLEAALAPGKTTQLQATVPAGTAPGEYDMAINDGSGCAALMTRAIVVTDNLSLDQGVVSPPFGSDSESQAMTIVLGSAASSSGVPRAFLNPPGDEPAVQLQSVTPVNSTTLTALVPSGTPAGQYDLVLVWPDGAVAVLSDAFTSVSGALPAIADAVPQSLVNATGQTLELRGTGFAGSELSLRCKTSGGEVFIAGSGATETCTTSCTQSATFDASSLATGDVCVARVTNDDGVYAEFSAVGITNSSYNLSAPRVGTPLNVARRALASSAIQASSAARFVYAIGGDGGAVASALASVEFAPVDLFGNMNPWQASRQPLPTARTFAADATIGRYVYVFGGNDGTGALASGARALVLSPEEIPSIANVDLCLGGGSTACFGQSGPGLQPGTYSYRVAAVIDSTDPQNLGGETLASDALILRLRGTEQRSILVKLDWTAPKDSQGDDLSGITAYRIYRTPLDGVPGSDEQLLAEVPVGATEFIDDGTDVLVPAETPLPLGSTSSWQALPNLNTAREGARGVAAVDPADPSTWYVYSLLGRNGTNGLTTYEYLPVTVLDNGRQTIDGAWTTGSEESAVGRWQHGAWAIDSVDSQFVSGSSTFVYLGGGLLGDESDQSGLVEAGLVQAGGELGELTDIAGPSDTVEDFTSTRAGYGSAGAADRLFVFGGKGNAAPLSNAIAAGFVSPSPDLANNAWNNEGLSMTTPRYLMGSSIQSAFIFLVGGDTGASNGVTSSTETVVW